MSDSTTCGDGLTVATTASRATWVPRVTCRRSTPGWGAVTVCSIFMASMVTSRAPASTASPSAPCTATTVPGSGATSSGSTAPGARPALARRRAAASRRETTRRRWAAPSACAQYSIGPPTTRASPAAGDAVCTRPASSCSHTVRCACAPPARHAPARPQTEPSAGAAASTTRCATAASAAGDGSGDSGVPLRSSTPVSRSPARTAGSARSARRSAMLVSTPSTTVSARAASRRARAVSRSGPWAMTLAIMGSYRELITLPVSTALSTRAGPGCHAVTVPVAGGIREPGSRRTRAPRSRARRVGSRAGRGHGLRRRAAAVRRGRSR